MLGSVQHKFYCVQYMHIMYILYPLGAICINYSDIEASPKKHITFLITLMCCLFRIINDEFLLAFRLSLVSYLWIHSECCKPWNGNPAVLYIAHVSENLVVG